MPGTGLTNNGAVAVDNICYLLRFVYIILYVEFQMAVHELPRLPAGPCSDVPCRPPEGISLSPAHCGFTCLPGLLHSHSHANGGILIYVHFMCHCVGVACQQRNLRLEQLSGAKSASQKYIFSLAMSLIIIDIQIIIISSGLCLVLFGNVVLFKCYY